MANSHLKGHNSLADMVSTHIEVWRDGLKLRREQAYDKLHGTEYESAIAFIDHEMQALNDIEKACEVEKEK